MPSLTKKFAKFSSGKKIRATKPRAWLGDEPCHPNCAVPWQSQTQMSRTLRVPRDVDLLRLSRRSTSRQNSELACRGRCKPWLLHQPAPL